MPRDQHLLTGFHLLQQSGEMGFGFKGTNAFQEWSNQLPTRLCQLASGGALHEKAGPTGPAGESDSGWNRRA